MPAAPKPFRVLFVCMGNICRSPAADIVMRKLVSSERLSGRIEIDSAGTIGYHTGKGPDPRMAATLTRRGYSPSGSARQVLLADLDAFDLVLAMDEDNFRDLRDLAKTAAQRVKIRRFTEFCHNHQATAVPDPYYGGDEGFEDVADLIEDGAKGLLAWISQQLPA
jgi:protein-tyrosine phosphatase